MLLSTSALSADPDVANKVGTVDKIGSMGPVPKAHCGRWDWTESGLQGQTTNWERFSINVPGSLGHMGNGAEDGKTYYIGQSFEGIGSIMAVVDPFTTFAIPCILPSSRTGRARLRGRLSFPDRAAGAWASIAPSKSRRACRAL